MSKGALDFLNLFILNWRVNALQHCVVSAVHQRESAIDMYTSPPSWASPVAQMVKDPLGMQETQVRSLRQEDALEKGWLPTPVSLSGEFHGRSSLPPLTPSHPSRLSQSTWFELSASYSKFPLTIYFTYSNAYVSMLLSQFIPPSKRSSLDRRNWYRSETQLHIKKEC